MNYYNEFDPFAAAWLRNLITDGLIPQGDVDDRDIRDVDPKDLKGYTQCHFFSGIAGWSLALQLAGWPDDRPVWTGSPPCQPFSAIGNQLGTEDERHLWPTFFNLVSECRPPVLFGEQVASAIGHGWLDDLCADLEAEGYAAGAVVLPACSVGALHKRDRIFFLADRYDARQQSGSRGWGGKGKPEEGYNTWRSGSLGAVGDAQRPRLEGHQGHEYRGDQPGWVKAKSCGSIAEAGLQSVTCLDGKRRLIPVESEIQPMVDGLPNHMDLIRGAGNAIVPQVAAEVIRAYMAIR